MPFCVYCFVKVKLTGYVTPAGAYCTGPEAAHAWHMQYALTVSADVPDTRHFNVDRALFRSCLFHYIFYTTEKAKRSTGLCCKKEYKTCTYPKICL